MEPIRLAKGLSATPDHHQQTRPSMPRSPMCSPESHDPAPPSVSARRHRALASDPHSPRKTTSAMRGCCDVYFRGFAIPAVKSALEPPQDPPGVLRDRSGRVAGGRQVRLRGQSAPHVLNSVGVQGLRRRFRGDPGALGVESGRFGAVIEGSPGWGAQRSSASSSAGSVLGTVPDPVQVGGHRRSGGLGHRTFRPLREHQLVSMS